MKYLYVYTADEKKFERIEKALRFVEKEGFDPVFAVNDIESIAFLKRKGFKALNVDAIVDLLNLLELEDSVGLITPEKTEVVLASFKNAKEIK